MHAIIFSCYFASPKQNNNIMEIDITNYLSHEEQKEIAIDVFRNQIKTQLFKSNDGTIQSDSEVQRIIGNVAHHIVMDEVQNFIPNFKDLVVEKTIQCLQKETFSYYVFKKKDAWDSNESLAVKYINETIISNKEIFQERIKEFILNYDLSQDVSNKICEEFNNMADNMYKLAELFGVDKNKSK